MLHAIQKGFFMSSHSQLYQRKIRDIQLGIKGKLGDLDSYERKTRVKQLFDEIDDDRSGEVDANELQKAFQSLDVFMPIEQVNEFIQAYDADGGGTIGFDEFLLMTEELLLQVCMCGCLENKRVCHHVCLFTCNCAPRASMP